ncbi:MAG: fructosamine kinase [Anaerolineaceae bacterium]|nr:fructosamine kinase [Anaerolineaceae bacterium]
MSDLPSALKSVFEQTMEEAGDPGPFEVLGRVGGGCINHATHVRSTKGDYFLKWNNDPLPGMFAAEVFGLKLLTDSQTVRIPAVVTVKDQAESAPAFLVLEWIPNRTTYSQTLLGEQLAVLHQTPGETRYGLEMDNYIGSSDQFNEWETDWVAFFQTRRLYPQMELAIGNGLMPAHRRKKLETLIEKLENWLGGVQRKPSLLHGDLWGGNVIAGSDGEPVLIDPAVYWGDREAEVAFTGMFGGFTDTFYKAYQHVYPLQAGYEDRFKIYNLYHLLNHLNLFGGGYAADVDATLAYFVG